MEETAFSILYMINIALIGGEKSPNQRRGLIVKLSICIILCVLLWPMMQVSRRFKSKVGMCDHFPLYYSTGTVWKIIYNKRGHAADSWLLQTLQIFMILPMFWDTSHWPKAEVCEKTQWILEREKLWYFVIVISNLFFHRNFMKESEIV